MSYRQLWNGSIGVIEVQPRCQRCKGLLTFRLIHEDKQHDQYRNYECEYCGEWHYFDHEMYDPTKPHVCRRIEE